MQSAALFSEEGYWHALYHFWFRKFPPSFAKMAMEKKIKISGVKNWKSDR
jgi:hypothetical protein